MFVAVENREVKEVLKLVDVVGEEGSVICLTHIAKPTLLGCDKLLIVVNLEKIDR